MSLMWIETQYHHHEQGRLRVRVLRVPRPRHPNGETCIVRLSGGSRPHAARHLHKGALKRAAQSIGERATLVRTESTADGGPVRYASG